MPYLGEDLIINPKDFPGINKGDIVEIYHPEDEFSRLLLQITSFKEDLQTRETISVEQSIATAFQLRTYADVYMNIVKPVDVALDSVELTFKDQYMGRSEMWRLKNSLVVFRSNTSMVYLFIQMSSEMWDFDIHGDLYFEKAVNGFLADLFQKWKKNGSNHEVTIVLFSRTFYKANNLEEFPGYMRECLQQDYKGRFYEDFYRVAVQNERYDDWTNTLVQLRRLFTDYQNIVLEYHKRPGVPIPNSVNSTAAQGNFLEVLNMSLNVFEKHYLDRSFDRTGQLSVVITPGVGVFEVDRELTNVTKQRIIDNGVGSDLVCVGEQPLHAVPLLKFHNKDTSLNAADDYSMPHWINLSFYSTNKKVAYSNFIPRIKLPPKRTKPCTAADIRFIPSAKSKLIQEDECMPNSLFDYDAYDAQVFQLPPVHTARFSQSLQRVNSRYKKMSVTVPETDQKLLKRKMSDPDIHHGLLAGTCSSPPGKSTTRSAAISIPQHRPTELSPQNSSVNPEVKSKVFVAHSNLETTSPPFRPVVGSAGSPSNSGHTQVNLILPGRALINPFDPSHVTIKLTSNRRRWTHIFPKGPSGVLIQQHHYQAVPAVSSEEQMFETVGGVGSTFSTSPGNENHAPNIVGSLPRSASQITFQQESMKGRSFSRPNLFSDKEKERVKDKDKVVKTNKSLTLLWGATGEQEWTPALTTGVDWKSLTIPACLPITTDYFPDKRSLQNDFVVSDYNLLPDDVNADFAQRRAIYKKPLTTKEVFRELVSQRLAQGFQLIFVPKPGSNKQAQTPGSAGNIPVSGISSLVMSRPRDIEPTEEYLLSIGRVFHKISLSGSAITVTRYRPRHPYPPFNIHYRYRFHAPHHGTYEMSWVSFTTEKLENFNWNYLDHYICTRGDTDFQLAEAQKYWRFRMYLLPLNHLATKKILEGADHCDIYTPLSSEELGHLVEDFLRFLETYINRNKRPGTTKILRTSTPPSPGLKMISRRHSASIIFHSQSSSQTSVVGNSPFRERLGSNRVLDKPRPRVSGPIFACKESVKPPSVTQPGLNHDVPVFGSLIYCESSALDLAATKVGEKHGNNRMADRTNNRSGSKVMERVKAEGGGGGSGRVSPASEVAVGEKSSQQQPPLADYHQSDSSQQLAEVPDESIVTKADFRLLKSSATLPEILESMRHPQTGVVFLMHHASLPSFTFISADAVQWVISHMEGVVCEEQAVTIMESMLKEHYICHASGDFSHPFIVGFYLYHLVHPEKEGQKDPEYLQPLGDLESFENEWIEVEVKHPGGWRQGACPQALEAGVPKFLRDTLPGSCDEDADQPRKWPGVNYFSLVLCLVPLYKHTHLETDVNNKSDRIEWGHCRYQSLYKPNRAYELVVQWVCSSGTIVSDLVSSSKDLYKPNTAYELVVQWVCLFGTIVSDLIMGWARKAQSSGFQVIPIPADPLALPFTHKSDPLRGPIFIPLDTECLMGNKSYLFEMFPEETWDQRLFHFQEAVLEKFGFVQCMVENLSVSSPGTMTHHEQYRAHGNSISRPGLSSKHPGIQGARRYPVHSDALSSPHEEYITRHVSGKNNDDYNTERRTGFLWSWNHMLSRRWRSSSTPATGDEMFQAKFLRDFREFCANTNNRLLDFWETSWTLKTQTSLGVLLSIQPG
uniref:DEP domain-containing protein n=1 Tax=Timema genevievae TaxID=629358 RepID=A0A7R9PJY0_TIMGE|nr:unnamed protein product [Timema genevievae]